ncbi:MAG: hypothetical protein ACKV19_06660 [Verrucomicrobiales bacterium]
MKSPAFTALLGACLLVTPAFGTIFLNEIHINPPPVSDLNYEYMELRSTTGGIEACTGLTLLIIENNGGQVGEVEEALNLNDFSTGANGLLLIGNGYNGAPAGGPWWAFKAPTTTTADPTGSGIHSGLGDDDLGPNGGLTFLLVRGWMGMSNATVNSLGDVDVDNDSAVDWLDTNGTGGGAQTTPPYAALVDSIGFPDLDNTPIRLPYTPVSANLNRPPVSATFAPDNISRRLSRANDPADANNASAWYGANLAGTEALSVAYDLTQFFGGFRGQATPGQTNLDAAPVVGNFLINEASVNPPKTDDNYEYVEILNAGGGAASLQGLALLVINSSDIGDPNKRGVIVEAWDLSTYNTGSNGLLLLGNNYPDGQFPWLGYADPETPLVDPAIPANPPLNRWSSMGNNDLGDINADNNGFTLLLVQGFNGTINQDLDSDNNGVLDVTPWTAIKDSVGFDQVAPKPEDERQGKTYATAKLASTPFYEFDNVSRKLANTTANTAEAWYAGDYGSNNSFGIGFQDTSENPDDYAAFGGFRGAATPGRANLNAAPTAASIRLNEIMVDPVSDPDGTGEFIELVNTAGTIGSMHGLTLVLADGREGAQNGRVLEAWDLSGLSTGPNGLALLGDSYDDISNNAFLRQQVSRLTVHDDIYKLDENDIGPNGGIIALLTKGSPPALDSNVSAIPAADIVDSIGFGTSPNPAITLLAPGFTPHHVSRYPGSYDASAGNAWFSGVLDPAFGINSIYYGATFAGTYKGGASPGRLNHAATPSTTASVLLNELNIDPPGADQSNEFIEFRASPGGAISTNGYTLLMIDSDGNNTGTILEAWSLDGMATGTNGLLLTGAGYPASSPWIDSLAPAAATRLGSPQFMAPGDIAGYSDNGAVSFLLVRYFSEFAGLDLDAGLPVTGVGADDGTIDITPPPWATLVDAAAMQQWDDSLNPPNWSSGDVYGGVNLRQSGYTPDTIGRHWNNITPSTAAAWYGGDIVPGTGTSTAYDPAEKFPGGNFAGLVTAGLPNVGADASDEDNDGVVYLIEAALNMDPAVADPKKLPQAGTVDVVGTLYPTLAYTRFLGGSVSGSTYIANGYRYEVEGSVDLVTWTNMTTFVSSEPISNSQTETAVYRPDTSYFNAALASGGKVFLRLKISRS